MTAAGQRSRRGASAAEQRNVGFPRLPAPRARMVLVALAAWSALVLASACSGDEAPTATATTTSTIGGTGSTAPVTVTAPPVPAGVEDCGETDEFAGWPTTTVPSPGTYGCILDAFASGTSAQMSHTAVGAGDSGRTTRDGYELPTRSITTWRVLGPRRVQETIDRTEDGKGSATRVCTGLALAGNVPKATGCSK